MNSTLCNCPLCTEFRKHYGFIVMDMVGEIELSKDQYIESVQKAAMLTTIPHVIQQKKTSAFKEWYRDVSGGEDFDTLIA